MNLIRELVFASILIVLSLRSCEGPSPQKKSLNIQKETPSLIKEPVKKTKNKINSSIYDRITKNATELLQPSPTPIESLSNQKKDQISLLLKVENFYPEDVFAYVNDKDPDKIDPDQIEIEFNPVKEKLAMILPLSKMKDLDGSVKNYENNSWIPLKSLKDLGLDVVYDSNSLSVQIKIPATQKESKTVSLARETEISLNNALEPSPISGFTNFYYNKTHLSGQIFANSSTYNPSVTYVDSALNVYKWVLESTGSYVEGQGYQRDQLRVVRDDEKNGVRYSVGDVSSPYGGFLASTSVGGVNVSRQDEITPYRVVYPINDTQILVKTRVSIDVEINGFTMYSTDLDSGTYDIKNFPFASGVNDGRIVVKDYYTKQVIDVVQLTSFSYSKKILRKGDNYFDYTAGYSRGSVDTGSSTKVLDKYYDKKDTIVTLTHSYGLLDRLTLTGYGQFKPEFSLLGIGTAISTPIGVLSLENAISSNSQYGNSGFGSKAELWYYRRKINFKLGFEKRFNQFTMLNESYNGNNIDHTYLASLGVNLSSSLSSYISEVSSYFVNNENTWETDVGINKNLSHSMLLTAVGTYGRMNLGTPQAQAGVRLSLTWNFDSQGVAYAKTDTYTQEDELRASYTAPIGEKTSVGVSAGVTRGIGENDYQTAASLNTEKGRIGVNNDVIQRANGFGNQSSIVGETGIAFAGSAFAWSRPINLSFAIFKGDGALKGQDLLVNPSSDFKSGQGETDFLGTALVPAIPYTRTKYIVALPDFREDTFLNSDNFDIVATHKSGTLITVFADKTVSLRGTLIGEDKLPLGEISGEMRTTELNSKDEPLFFYTNSNGRFVIEGIKNKEYEITFFTNDSKIKITIPQGVSGGYEIGEIYAPFRKND